MIAIVDDDKGASGALEKFVQSLGHNACTFGSAEEFLKSEKLHDILCLITDLQMPGLSGLDLQDRLIAEGHPIPVILGRVLINVAAMTAASGSAFGEAERTWTARRVRSVENDPSTLHATV
jgi:FixJ family two-component response regulator